MAYTEQLEQILVARAVDLNSVADVTGANWTPLAFPVMVHGIFAAVGNTIAAAGVLKCDKRVTFGDDTGRGDGDLGVITFATTHTGGKVVYHLLSTPVKVSPGEQAVFQVTDATGASDVADIGLLVSPSWERPANISAMVATV